MPTVTLIGYRGTGKTTVAAGLARRLGCPWWDADIELERRVGTTIASLIRDHGEPHFRDEEAGLLGELLATPEGVLATGGGVILRPGNRQRLRELKAAWQHVLEEAADELHRIEGQLLPAVRSAPAVGERDPAVVAGDDSVVADPDSECVGRQVFQRHAAVTDGLRVDDPVASPDGRIDFLEEPSLAQGLAKLPSKHF